MTFQPTFPPAYDPKALGAADPFAAACAAAVDGGEDGLLFWSDDTARARAAVVLRPEMPAKRALPLLLVGMVGLGDALGTFTPPEFSVTFDWPDRIRVNTGLVGGLHLAHAPVATELSELAWLVLAIDIRMRRQNTADPGFQPDHTAMDEEGCPELESAELIDAFARHFLLWVSRWQDDGLGPVAAAFAERATIDGMKIDSFGNAMLPDGARRTLFSALAAGRATT